VNVSVVTPRGAVLARPADEVVAPGALGELGVLPGHIPMLVALRAGVVVVREGGRREVVAVGPGYLQVGAGDRVQVLVERAEPPSEIDVDEARRAEEEAWQELKKGGMSGADLAAAQGRLEWARARLEAAQRAR
jgi:F-type H+-transporting ATPase subunit epsilon